VSVQTRQVVTNASTAVPLLIAGQSEGRVTVFLENIDGTAANFVYVGGPGVTSTTGWRLAAGGAGTVQAGGSVLGPLELGSGDDLYGIAAAGTPTVHVLTRV
jgi:hypothetical protein